MKGAVAARLTADPADALLVEEIRAMLRERLGGTVSRGTVARGAE